MKWRYLSAPNPPKMAPDAIPIQNPSMNPVFMRSKQLEPCCWCIPPLIGIGILESCFELIKIRQSTTNQHNRNWTLTRSPLSSVCFENVNHILNMNQIIIKPFKLFSIFFCEIEKQNCRHEIRSVWESELPGIHLWWNFVHFWLGSF